MLDSLLIKRQAGGLQPYLKMDFDADFFQVNVEEFFKGLVKPIQHFIQHNKNTMLNEMLDRFSKTQKEQKKKKSCSMKKNRVGRKFDCEQIFQPTFSGSS